MRHEKWKQDSFFEHIFCLLKLSNIFKSNIRIEINDFFLKHLNEIWVRTISIRIAKFQKGFSFFGVCRPWIRISGIFSPWFFICPISSHHSTIVVCGNIIVRLWTWSFASFLRLIRRQHRLFRWKNLLISFFIQSSLLLFFSFNLFLFSCLLFFSVVDLVIFMSILFHISLKTLPFLIIMILTSSFTELDLTLRMIFPDSRLLSFCRLGRNVSRKDLFHIVGRFPLKSYGVEQFVPLSNQILIIDVT